MKTKKLNNTLPFKKTTLEQKTYKKTSNTCFLINAPKNKRGKNYINGNPLRKSVQKQLKYQEKLQYLK